MKKSNLKKITKILDDDINYSSLENPSSLNDMTLEERQKFIRNNWKIFISYYRKNIDDFCVDILEVKLHPFQRYILRAMAKKQYSMLICCRGLGE